MENIIKKYVQFKLESPFKTRDIRLLKISRDPEIKSWRVEDQDLILTTREGEEILLKYFEDYNRFQNERGDYILSPVEPFIEEFRADILNYEPPKEVVPKESYIVIGSKYYSGDFDFMKLTNSLHLDVEKAFNLGYDRVLFVDGLSNLELTSLIEESKNEEGKAVNFLYPAPKSYLGISIYKDKWEKYLKAKKPLFNFFKNLSENISRQRLEVRYIKEVA